MNVSKFLNLQKDHLWRGTDEMVPATLRESDTGARAEVKAPHGNHPAKRRRREVIWTGIEKGTVTETEIELMIQRAGGEETGSERRVEAEKGMITTEL